ncbi:MAG: hypothetical protein KA795_11630 [Burkholderiaceae bacterium]|nr:hypothetical protein [Burkholderiaceae bacterium]
MAGRLQIFYCGRADNAEKRSKEHQRDCADPFNAKEAYEYARQAFNGVFRFEVICDESERNTEDYWCRTLLAEGHPLKNSTGGNSVVPKRREHSDIAKAFREVNRRAREEEWAALRAKIIIPTSYSDK